MRKLTGVAGLLFVGALVLLFWPFQPRQKQGDSTSLDSTEAATVELSADLTEALRTVDAVAALNSEEFPSLVLRLNDLADSLAVSVDRMGKLNAEVSLILDANDRRLASSAPLSPVAKESLLVQIGRADSLNQLAREQRAVTRAYLQRVRNDLQLLLPSAR